MMGRSHVLVGAAGFLTVGPTLLELGGHRPLSAAELVCGTVVASGAALLPDIDHPQATIARSLGPVTGVISRVANKAFGGHRVGTHSLAFAAAVALGVSAALAHFPGPLLSFLLCFFFTSLAVRVLTDADPAVGAAISAGVASAMMMAAPARAWLAAAICIGILLHDLGDLWTTEGVPLMWPLSKERVSVPIVGATGGFRERLVAIGSGILICAVYWTTVLSPQLHI